MIVASPEFKDLDLPVYSESTELTSVQELFNDNNIDAGFERNQSSPDTVVRPVQITVDDTQLVKNGLMDILRRADDEFRVAAEMCDALVVGHEWGLYSVQNKDKYSEFSPMPTELLPEDYILVAKVDVIRGTKDLVVPGLIVAEDAKHWYASPEVTTHVNQGVRNYYASDRPYHHGDIRDNQFVVGACHQVTGNMEHTWLVDIEPVF